jgi:hypothetical protein
LDVPAASDADPKRAAALLDCTPSQLIRLLKLDPHGLDLVNRWRRDRQMHALQQRGPAARWPTRQENCWKRIGPGVSCRPAMVRCGGRWRCQKANFGELLRAGNNLGVCHGESAGLTPAGRSSDSRTRLFVGERRTMFTSSTTCFGLAGRILARNRSVVDGARLLGQYAEDLIRYVLEHITDLLWRIQLCGLTGSSFTISAFR